MSAPIKVLYMLHDARRSGVPAVVSSLISALDPARVKPSVLFAYEGVYAADLRQRAVEVKCFARRFPFLWRFNRFLFNLHLLGWARRFDIIHVHSVKLACSVIFAKWLGAKVVFHLHELPGRIGPILKLALRMADRVVFCSFTCQDHFRSAECGEKRIILNAITLPDCTAPRQEPAVPTIVMVGSLNGGKGQDLLLKAFSRLPDKAAVLYFYGTVGLSAHKYVFDLKRFVKTHGLAERVFFAGPTSDVWKVLRNATILVHTSWRESFGMALLEAMSCGVPVIAHDLEGMREVVADGVTGYLVPPGCVDELAARISELLENPELRQRLGSAGYAMVRERFDMKKRVDEYYTLYRELASAPAS